MKTLLPLDTHAQIEARIERVFNRLPQTGTYTSCTHKQNVMIKLLVKHVHQALTHDMNLVLKEHELNHVSFTALMMLYSSERESFNPSDLSEATSESRANVTRICDELVTKGLLMRAPSDVDRRRIDLKLAPEGVATIEKILPSYGLRLGRILDRFQDEELQQLESLLSRLLEGLTQNSDQAGDHSNEK